MIQSGNCVGHGVGFDFDFDFGFDLFGQDWQSLEMYVVDRQSLKEKRVRASCTVVLASLKQVVLRDQNFQEVVSRLGVVKETKHGANCPRWAQRYPVFPYPPATPAQRPPPCL
jgi:hypothetical protein